MALASLRFQRNAQDYEETRQGMTVFAGDAASFHAWQFRLQIKKSLCKAAELPALTAKVVDALRGEALSCAMEIGLAKLMEANGLDLLVQKVQERLFPQRTAEARELLKDAHWRSDQPSPESYHHRQVCPRYTRMNPAWTKTEREEPR